jgi:hypothetical protein
MVAMGSDIEGGSFVWDSLRAGARLPNLVILRNPLWDENHLEETAQEPL